ncbi:DNA-binding transcriptional regulator AgaR [compost metagenome]
MSRRMVEAAYHTIVLADASKLDKEAFVEIVPLRKVHTIVSEAAPPKEWLQMLRSNHIQWIEAK